MNAPANMPAIGLELGLAGATGPNATAETRQRRTHASEPRQEIIELRQLHLIFALAAAGALGKYIENEHRLVDDLHTETI